MKQSIYILWFFSALGLSSCDDPQYRVNQIAQSIGVIDSAVPQPIYIDVICDVSAGSTCSVESLGTTIETALHFAARRPESKVRLWFLGLQFADTKMAGVQIVPATSKRNTKAVQAQEKRFCDSAQVYFRKAAEPFFNDVNKIRSPIAEGISKVLMLTGSGDSRQRLLIVITDAREVSEYGDFECKPLPAVDSFLTRMHGNGLLMPGSMKNTTAYFTQVSGLATGGRTCPVTVARESGIRQLWTQAMKVAGAGDVRFFSDSLELETEAQQ